MDTLYAEGSFLEMVKRRIRLSDPPEIKRTFDRLVLSGYSYEEALDRLRAVLAEQIWITLERRGSLSKEEFVALLRRLE